MKPEDSDAIKVYRKSASAKDFHLMSGNSSINTTLFVSNEIIRNFPLEADDLLIDVGCGDGTFLSLANKKVKNSVGVVTTQKELLRLERELPGLRFVVGSAQNLPFNTHYANKLVCNSVLLLLDKTNVKKALEEINRVVTNNGLVYIGEIPDCQEFTFEKSIVKRGIQRLKMGGVIQFAKLFFGVIMEKFKEGEITRIETHFFIQPHDFISLAKENNLKFVSMFRHRTSDKHGDIFEINRWNYIFTKEG